jgi:hypothetical protein
MSAARWDAKAAEARHFRKSRSDETRNFLNGSSALRPRRIQDRPRQTGQSAALAEADRANGALPPGSSPTPRAAKTWA